MLHILVILQFTQENKYCTDLGFQEHPLVTRHGRLRHGDIQLTRDHYNQRVPILIKSTFSFMMTAHAERVADDHLSDADTLGITTWFNPPPHEIFRRPAPKYRCSPPIPSDQRLSARCGGSPLRGFRRITVSPHPPPTKYRPSSSP